ncbi:class I SAM-dependent methyltransferase [Isoptericola sp. NEAU-Y5]|uniref:Class I SAM-dependent methyltransferase n=1 Tax=Isoptericola luteus TaxID=2879484 RepID=A0ABS7ZBN4_9MICO|nr:methyltransferase domain-containing protein [Isoptericola sp. NEAU-Y5]MCA5892440.1 class I SAM-dependent methyltransferase [Isoptericola sp. NEAU-Y5]
MTTTDARPAAAGAVDPARVQEFAGQMFGALSAGATTLMVSIGHRTGLFDTLAGLPPSTSAQIAAEAGLHERYVREWLGAMTAARIVTYDPATATYLIPPEHAAVLTRAAGPDNLASLMQFVPLLAGVQDPVVRCFREGGGVGYPAFDRFHDLMAEQSAQTNDAALIDRVVPLVPGLAARLAEGIRLADIGCGQGHAVNLLAREYPRSELVGYDFEADAVEAARAEAREWNLPNARFEVRDVADLAGTGTFGAITAFDAIHDQAHPAAVLSEVAAHLDPDGVFLMVDMRASSDLEKNLEIPWAPYLYTVSTMHCMTVSLGLDGDGLGTVWGVETALRMLAEAGFEDVRVETLDEDFINAYFVARR